jgi:hypothetical protein
MITDSEIWINESCATLGRHIANHRREMKNPSCYWSQKTTKIIRKTHCVCLPGERGSAGDYKDMSSIFADQ